MHPVFWVPRSALVPSVYRLLVSFCIFFLWNNANASLTVNTDDLFGPWQVNACFLVNCRGCRACTSEVESSRTSLASRTSLTSKTHFEVLGLGLEASSPWPWPRSLKFSKTALSSARGQHYFLNSWNFIGKRQKPHGKFVKPFLFSSLVAQA